MTTHTKSAQRTPVYFDGCMGWLHLPSTACRSTMAAILCAPFGQEEICTHHGFMELADELAGAGIPAVRFDYCGTGNSAPSSVSLTSMVEDTARAAEYLRSQVGPCSVVLVGVRLGAAVALQAQRRVHGLQALVLMAPILSGHGYLRETRAAAAVARLAALDIVHPQHEWRPLNTNGFHWTATLQQEIDATDESHWQPHPSRSS